MNGQLFINDAEKIIPPVNDSPYKRILAIGDVHGAFDRLESLLEKISPTDDDLVIFLGDYFGEETQKNLETLFRLDELNERENFIILRGNMDEEFMTIFLRRDGLHLLIEYFFRSQPSLFNGCKQNVPRKLFDLLNGLPASHLVKVGDKKIFFCHAGIQVGVPLEHQNEDWLVGNYGYKDFYKNYAGEDLIVVGHKSPKKIWEELPELFPEDTEDIDAHKPLKVPGKNILMLDTRAKDEDGILTCVDVLTGQYWQSDDAEVKVMFVCAWNTCRSAMAEYIMRHLLKTAGLDDKIYVDSAGCVTEGGEPIGRRTSLTLKANNIPIGEHMSKPFVKIDYKNFDCIIALDEDILRHMQRSLGGDPDNKIRLFKDTDGNKISVEDPGYGGEHSVAYEKIYRGCAALLKELAQNLEA